MDKRGDITSKTPQVEGQSKTGRDKGPMLPPGSAAQAKQYEDHPLTRASDSLAEAMKKKSSGG